MCTFIFIFIFYFLRGKKNRKNEIIVRSSPIRVPKAPHLLPSGIRTYLRVEEWRRRPRRCRSNAPLCSLPSNLFLCQLSLHFRQQPTNLSPYSLKPFNSLQPISLSKLWFLSPNQNPRRMWNVGAQSLPSSVKMVVSLSLISTALSSSKTLNWRSPNTSPSCRYSLNKWSFLVGPIWFRNILDETICGVLEFWFVFLKNAGLMVLWEHPFSGTVQRPIFRKCF